MEVSRAPPKKPSRRKAFLAFAAIVVIIGAAFASSYVNWGPTQMPRPNKVDEQPKITDAELPDIIEDNRKNLDLRNAAVTDAGLAQLEVLKKELKRLNLQGTGITDEGVAHLKGMTELVELNLGGTRITDQGLEYLQSMPALTTLNLQATKITDEGVKHLAKLQSLQRMSIIGTKITRKGREELEKALKDCTVFPPLKTPKPPAPIPENARGDG